MGPDAKATRGRGAASDRIVGKSREPHMRTSLRPVPFFEGARPQLRAVSSAVVLRDLRREYGGREVVRGVSLEIPAGEIFGLLGPNGASKTTLLSMISTRLRPTSGDAWVLGKNVTHDVDAVRVSRAECA